MGDVKSRRAEAEKPLSWASSCLGLGFKPGLMKPGCGANLAVSVCNDIVNNNPSLT